MKGLLRCVECNELFQMTDYDSSPEYQVTENGEIHVIPRDERRSFLASHKGHKIERLKVKKGSLVSDQPYMEPIKTTYFQATNGKESFIVKRWRESIDSPMRYELIKGDIVLVNEELGVQVEEIRKQLAYDFKDEPLSEKKIKPFIESLQRIVARLNPGKLKVTLWDSRDPLVAYCRLDKDSVRRLIGSSKKVFSESEFKRIRKFIQENNHYNDAITLRRQSHFAIKTIDKRRKSDDSLYPVPKEQVLQV